MPSNILFDGERLWLIDWESAYRNDPLVDVAIVSDSFALSLELEDVCCRLGSAALPTRPFAPASNWCVRSPAFIMRGSCSVHPRRLPG